MEGMGKKTNYRDVLESNPMIDEWILDIIKSGRKYGLTVVLTDKNFQLLKDKKVIYDIDLKNPTATIQGQFEDLMVDYPVPSGKEIEIEKT